MMLSLTSVTPPGETLGSDSGGPEIEVDTMMSVVKENEDEASSPTNRPVKKMRFDQALDKLTDEAEKNAAIDENKAVAAAVELSVWLKDFPKSADDFKELRRSGA